MLRLQLRKRPEVFIKLTSSLSLGRDESNDLVVDAPTVSDFHAEIVVEGDTLSLLDLLSASGTFLNGRRIDQRTPLACWDVVRLGAVELEVCDPGTCRPGDWALRMESDLLASQFYPLQAVTVVGRDAECDVVIEGSLLSRRHAELTINEDILEVVDLGSTNGTFLNGARIEQAQAQPGDELCFDKHAFIVVGPTATSLKQTPAAGEQTLLRDEQTCIRALDTDEALPLQSDELEQETCFMPVALAAAKLAGPVDFMQPAELDLSESRYTLGRSSLCDVTLADSSVSKQHAILRRVDSRWSIEDLGSSNGIKLNGEKVVRAELTSGDAIELGRVELRFASDTASLDEHATALYARAAPTVAPVALGSSSPRSRVRRMLPGLCILFVAVVGSALVYFWRTGRISL